MSATPWTDCPRCPDCKGPFGLPITAADWNHRASPGDRIACPACGTGWVGTEEEVAQAQRAQAAWEAHEVEEHARTSPAPLADVARWWGDEEEQP